MNDQPQLDAPRLPNRNRDDFGGSLADHVRQYATDDPYEAGVRDTVAGVAETLAKDPITAEEVNDITPEDPVEGEVWETLPAGTMACLSKDGHLCTVAGGLWTDTVTGQQYGHGYFTNSMGPFRPAPQGA